MMLCGAAPIRIVAGGPGVTDQMGRLWQPDAHYDAGNVYATRASIAGAGTPALYQTERYHGREFRYKFCVPDGTYKVRLKFAEIWFTSPGRRVFDVAINGKTVLESFDIVARAGGPNRAIDTEFRVAAVNNAIEIEFTPGVSNPKISAIEIIQ
jgi:hypothetical protein